MANEIEDVINIPFDDEDLENAEPVYRTYRMDFEHKRIAGFVDGLEACQQAAWKALNTTRFAHVLYDDQYGNDLFAKMKNNSLTPEYLDAELPILIEDCLTADERITEITDFAYEIIDRDSVHCSFTVVSIYGEFGMEGVIEDGD